MQCQLLELPRALGRAYSCRGRMRPQRRTTAGQTSTPVGLAAELIKAPLRLLNLSRRQINPLHILYLQVKQCQRGMSKAPGI